MKSASEQGRDIIKINENRNRITDVENKHDYQGVGEGGEINVEVGMDICLCALLSCSVMSYSL